MATSGPPVGASDDAQRGRFNRPRDRIDDDTHDAVVYSAAPALPRFLGDDLDPAGIPQPVSATAPAPADVDLLAPGAVTPAAPIDVAALAAAQPLGPDAATLAAMGLRPLRRVPGSGTLRRPPPAPPARNAAARRAAHLVGLKQKLTDLFRAWRRGAFHWENWDPQARRPVTRAIPIPPRQGRWPGFVPNQQAMPNYQSWWVTPRGNARARMMRNIRRLNPRARRGSGDGDERLSMANELQRQLAAGFRPAGWEVKRRLGMGGFGAVFLLNMIGESGAKVPIVVKGGVQSDNNVENMDAEKNNLVLMAGARHFLQRVILSDLPLPATASRRVRGFMSRRLTSAFSRLGLGSSDSAGPGFNAPAPAPAVPPPRSVRSRTTAESGGGTMLPRVLHWQSGPARDPAAILQARGDLDDARDTIVLENMPRGSVHDLITKLTREDLRLSNRMLWLIFECLFKGCLAMAYPREFQNRDRDPRREMMPQQDEFVPDRYLGGRDPDRPLVHFDLDPHNVLIGDHGPPGTGHEFVPIFKIADPGLADVMTPELQNDEVWNWRARETGKPGNFHPEQFTPEWEYEAAISMQHLHHQPTAANYNWWSNLFQVGWIMWSLMTKAYPPWPPVAVQYAYDDEAPGAIPGDQLGGWSYGMQLRSSDYDVYDLALRQQIYRCLEHNALRRPRSYHLESVIQTNLRRYDLVAAESDEDLRAAARVIFGGP